MIPSTITLVKNEDGSHSWKENGVLKQCKYPVQPIFAGNNIIAPKQQCTTHCAMCTVKIGESVTNNFYEIHIGCGSTKIELRANDIEEAAKVISPGKGSLVM